LSQRQEYFYFVASPYKMAKPLREIRASSPAWRSQAQRIPLLAGKLVSMKAGSWESHVRGASYGGVWWHRVGGVRTSPENKPKCCE